MKIAHCIHGLGLGGAQKVIAAIVRNRRPDIFQPFVYSSEDGVLRQEVAEAGATVRIIPRHLPKFDPLWVARLARAMHRDRIDLVHTHLFGDSLHGHLAARIVGGVPVVMTLHIGDEGLNRLQRRGYRWLLTRCTRTVACSQAVHDSFLAAFGPAAGNVAVVRNGIEVPAATGLAASERAELRRDLGVDPAAVLLAGVGRLVEQKGFRHLIAAFARLPGEVAARVRLILMGDGPLRAELERQAREAGAAQRVVFTGFRPDAFRVLQAVDIVVFSSLFEGLPIALLEAMAAGRCIVVTDAPGMTEAIRAEREGLVVPRGDVAGLAEALRRAATLPEVRSRLGAAARRRFRAEFTAERMVSRYEETYLAVAAEKGGRE